MKYWTSDGLSKVGSLVGRPIIADKPTEERDHLLYARTLIEIDFAKEPKEVVYIRDEQGGISEQKVFLEWKPFVCSNCGILGHSLDKCRHNTEMKVDNSNRREKEKVIVGLDTEGGGQQSIPLAEKEIVQGECHVPNEEQILVPDIGREELVKDKGKEQDGGKEQGCLHRIINHGINDDKGDEEGLVEVPVVTPRGQRQDHDFNLDGINLSVLTGEGSSNAKSKRRKSSSSGKKKRKSKKKKSTKHNSHYTDSNTRSHPKGGSEAFNLCQ